ncbi:MAG: hypothetical protein EOM12_14785 [Verrucomicrobiae bacterium]|nr:hypothetical protein [Verrucomicrobiae bacterium]
MDHVRMVINYGQSRKYHHDLVGWNARLDTLQAGILLAKLQHLNEWNERRRNNAVYYRKILNGLPVVLPTERNDCRHIYHLFVIQCDHRDELLSFLADKGISCGIHYPIPIHFQKAFACLDYAKGTFPIAEQQAGRILSLPMCAELSHEQMDYIADSFSAFFN